jgi:hypothetical protein
MAAKYASVTETDRSMPRANAKLVRSSSMRSGIASIANKQASNALIGPTRSAISRPHREAIRRMT